MSRVRAEPGQPEDRPGPVEHRPEPSQVPAQPLDTSVIEDMEFATNFVRHATLMYSRIADDSDLVQQVKGAVASVLGYLAGKAAK